MLLTVKKRKHFVLKCLPTNIIYQFYTCFSKFNLFQPSVAIHIETSSHITDFYLKCNLGLKWSINYIKTIFKSSLKSQLMMINLGFTCDKHKCQPHKIVKYTQAIRRQQPTNCLSVIDHIVGLVLKKLRHKLCIQNFY